MIKNVKISQEKDQLIIEDASNEYKVAFLDEISWANLELRGYETVDENNVLLFLSLYRTASGFEGYSDLIFSYTRSGDERWLLDGYMTN